MAVGSRQKAVPTVLSFEHRSKISNSSILNHLIEHVEGTRELSATQVSAGIALLKKVMPDLAAVQHSGEDGGPMKVEFITIYEAKKDSMAKDYRLKVRIRNNRLLTAIEGAGYNSIAEFSRKSGIAQTSVNGLVCMREPARRKNGEWTGPAHRLADVLGLNPEDLFNEKQAEGFAVTTAEREIDEPPSLTFEECEQDMLPAPDLSPEVSVEQKELVTLALAAMTPRQRDIVSKRFGLGEDSGEETYAVIAADHGRSVERVRQIEFAGLRKARYALKMAHVNEHFGKRLMPGWASAGDHLEPIPEPEPPKPTPEERERYAAIREKTRLANMRPRLSDEQWAALEAARAGANHS